MDSLSSNSRSLYWFRLARLRKDALNNRGDIRIGFDDPDAFFRVSQRHIGIGNIAIMQFAGYTKDCLAKFQLMHPSPCSAFASQSGCWLVAPISSVAGEKAAIPDGFAVE